MAVGLLIVTVAILKDWRSGLNLCKVDVKRREAQSPTLYGPGYTRTREAVLAPQPSPELAERGDIRGL
jgi:hypothetical protein